MKGGKRKRGKRRPYTMSAKAIAQRHVAAWKTGEHAATASAQTIPPCKRSLCPMTEEAEKGNCPAKRAVEERGGALEQCAVRLVSDPTVKAAYLSAIRGKGREGLEELSAETLAAMHHLATDELAELQAEGLVRDEEVVGPGGMPFTVRRENPRAKPTIEFLKMLGQTAAEQTATPKSRGEQERDNGLASLFDLLTERAARAPLPAKG